MQQLAYYITSGLKVNNRLPFTEFLQPQVARLRAKRRVNFVIATYFPNQWSVKKRLISTLFD